MTQENNTNNDLGNEDNEHDQESHDDHLEIYSDDPKIASKDAPVPRWLKFVYAILPIWGVITFYIFCNGTHGWLDSGHWNQLQKAALTTFPTETIEGLEVKK